MSRRCMTATRRRRVPRLALGFAAALALLSAPPAHSQMFAHRIVISVPLDDTTRTVGLLPGFDYVADIEHASHSTDDERAWDARIGGTIELWRLPHSTAILAGVADEMVANSLKDGGFNPRGISWQLEIGAAHRFSFGTMQLDFEHYCRHAIDDIDPPGPAYFVPDYVATQRTISVNGPRLRYISPSMRVGRRVTLRGAISGERYQDQWDGREVIDEPGAASANDSWIDARGSIGADLRIDTDVWHGSGVFLRASGIDVLFGRSAVRPETETQQENHRIELGWHERGGRGSLELYGAVEQLFDDISSIAPHGSHIAGIGIRLFDLNQF